LLSKRTHKGSKSRKKPTKEREGCVLNGKDKDRIREGRKTKRKRGLKAPLKGGEGKAFEANRRKFYTQLCE